MSIFRRDDPPGTGFRLSFNQRLLGMADYEFSRFRLLLQAL